MGFSIGFDVTGAAFGFGGMIGLQGNFSQDPSSPWYSGWSSSVTFVLGGGAAASVYGFTGGVQVTANNSCNVSQLNGPFLNAGRLGLGAFSVGGYTSPDNTVTGGGIIVGPSIGYIGAFAGGTNTWTLTGGSW